MLWRHGFAYQFSLKKSISVYFTVLTLFAILILSFASLPPSHAASCPSNTTSGNGDTFNVVVTGADGSCPPTYSSSGLTHYALSSGAAQNPYTIALSSCSGTNCPPTEIIIQGWGSNEVVCGGGQPACSSTGPWTFNVDATVQSGKACDTAPVKVTGTAGQPDLILEAGVGGVCAATTTVTTTVTTWTTKSTDTSYTSTTLTTTLTSTETTTVTIPTTTTTTSTAQTTTQLTSTTTVPTTVTTGACTSTTTAGNAKGAPLPNSHAASTSTESSGFTSTVTTTVTKTTTLTTVTLTSTSTVTSTTTVTSTVPTTSTATSTVVTTSTVPVTTTETVPTTITTCTAPTTGVPEFPVGALGVFALFGLMIPLVLVMRSRFAGNLRIF